jgi:hypothetical protein
VLAVTKTEIGNVVKNYKVGNTRIVVCDDYCRNRTKPEIDAILAKIACRAQEHLSVYASAQPPDDARLKAQCY